MGGQEEHGYDGAQGTWLDLSLGQLVDTPRDLMNLINQQQTAINEVLAHPSKTIPVCDTQRRLEAPRDI